MRFHLNSDQVAIQDVVYNAVQDALKAGRLHDLIESSEEFDERSWKAARDLEVFAMMVPEEDGGSGLGLLEAALVSESIGRAAAPGPFIGQIMMSAALSLTTNQAAKSAWLSKVSEGRAMATFAFGGDWLPSGWTVETNGSDANGSVRFVPCAGQAEVFLAGTRDGGLALVEAGSSIDIHPVRSTDRSRPISRVTFNSACAHTLFEPGDPVVQRIFDMGLVLLAADALGGMQYCTDLSVEYAKERQQFGQPIGRFQALKHQLSTMALNLESARSLVWYAAYAWDNQQEDCSRTAALSKAHLCECYTRVTRDAIAAHGGIGYTWEYGLNIWFRRSIFDRSVMGAPAVHRARAADLAGW